MEPLKRIANRIWKFGESKFPGSGCFVGSDFSDGYNDDDIIDKYDATHYDIKWEEKGKTVRLNLYSGDSFGACINVGEVKYSFVIEV